MLRLRVALQVKKDQGFVKVDYQIRYDDRRSKQLHGALQPYNSTSPILELEGCCIEGLTSTTAVAAGKVCNLLH